MTLEEIIKELNFDKDIEAVILNTLNDEGEKIKRIAETAYEKDGRFYRLCSEDPLTRLVVITYLAKQAYDIYDSYHIDHEIIIDTLKDISLRANMNYQRTGNIGLSKMEVDWLSRFLEGKIFKLGVMQFEITKMYYIETIGREKVKMEYPEEIRSILTEDTYVINCHLQDGVKPDPDAVGEAKARAVSFFKEYFPEIEFKAFLGYTWFFYPKMVEHLPATSRIRQLAERYEVISSCPWNTLAMERLFPYGQENNGKPLTSLQKMAVEHPDWFGFSCGVIWL